MKKTMRQIVLEYALETLIETGGNRSLAANDLAVSVRTVRNYVEEIRKAGYSVPKSSSKVQIMKRELEEFKAGVRKPSPKAAPYCPRCGKSHGCPQ